MEAAVTQAFAPSRWLSHRIDAHALSAWALASGLVLYLAVDGGGYSLASHGQVAIVVWWVVVISAAWRLLPVARPSRAALWTVGLFAAFTAWTALGITWSISSGRSFQDLVLVTCYLGILVLALAVHRERGQAARHTTAAVATAIVAVAVLALASRLWPSLFPASQQTSQLLAGARSRLSWPLNYWNALATLMAIGIPLLLAQATTARTLVMRGAAAAAIPLVVLCSVLTLSRGGAIEGVIAAGVFIALAPDRIPKLAMTATAAVGSAVLIYGGLSRHAIQQGLNSAAEHHQAGSLIIVIVLVCAGVWLAQAGVALLDRHATLPRLLTISPRRARLFTLAGVVLVVAVAIAAGAPHRVQHAWDSFKSPVNTTSGASASRLGSASGEGRYQYWVAGIDSAKHHVLTGSGPGTFQLDWLPRATLDSYVENAHSLYVETYTELGLVGLVLLVGFFVAALAVLLRLMAHSGYEDRTRAAALTAALVAFLVAAALDWVWQMPVVAAAILLLIGAAAAPPRRSTRESRRLLGPQAEKTAGSDRRAGVPAQVAMVIVGLACLLAAAYPLATSSAIANSQTAAGEGNIASALADARSAVRLESGSGAAQIQLALVYEQMRDYPGAVAAAERAVSVDSQDWSDWLVLSRLQAENGNTHGSLVSYLEAKSLNPQSSLFHQS